MEILIHHFDPTVNAEGDITFPPPPAGYGDSALTDERPICLAICSMARLARTVIPDLAHHVTQRGNGRCQMFSSPDDYRFYRDLMVENCQRAAMSIRGWCLMPNHVHLILVPTDADGLRRALSTLHRAYAAWCMRETRKPVISGRGASVQ